MSNGQINIIKDTIELVEKNMKEISNLEQLSDEMAISKYHLHRIFRSITGKSLMSYIRNRKLTLSLQDLINTNLNVIDIANEYRFDYEQSYIRAFKQMFEVTPSQFRRNPRQLTIEQKIDINIFENIGEGVVIKPHMVIEPLFYLQGIQAEIIHEDNYLNMTTNQLAEEFWTDYRMNIPNRKNENTYYGLVRYRENSEYSNDYATCIETTVLNPISAPYVQYTISTSEYAVFRYIGLHNPHKITFKTLLDLYNYIDNWLAHTSYKQLHSYHFEKMDFSICDDNYCEMDIYIPITTVEEK